ncbi:MAG TPA: DnaA N-terminal domain-containing protein, partial [Acidimicrobiales bacterium]|nr:DnaA N-terminal domain-containing protein [Acidimicrobiales bacterium]
MSDAAILWTSCCEVLREEVGEAVWRTWFEGVTPVGLENGRLLLSAPSSLARDRLEDRYGSLIEKVASQVADGEVSVDVGVRPAPAPVQDPL